MMFAVPFPEPSPPPLFSASLTSSSSSSTATSEFLIVILIIAFAIFGSIFFHLLRKLSRRGSSSSPPPIIFSDHSADSPKPSDDDHEVSPFPLLPVSSADSILHKSPDCAVCLSPFCRSDDLRLLPSCRHIFHLQCIDMWLRSTPSCPLCRSPADPAKDSCGSSGFEVEIDLSDSIRSSIEHLMSDEAEAGPSIELASTIDRVKDDNGDGEGEVGRGTEVREEGRGWLREYLDRMTSSASSSFNSLTFSGRLSGHRFDSGSIESIAAVDVRSWDVEGVEWVEETGLAGIYRWFVGM